MVGVKKIVADRTNETVIPQLRDEGYDHIALYYHTHPKHQTAGLQTDKMLVYAWRYKPRLDRRNKKVGET